MENYRIHYTLKYKGGTSTDYTHILKADSTQDAENKTKQRIYRQVWERMIDGIMHGVKARMYNVHAEKII